MTTRPLQRYEPDTKYIGTGESIPCLSADPDGECVLYVDHLADRAKLLAEIARLEGMVPRWVKFLSDEQSALLDLGWASSMEADRISGYFVLMVPPIPLPEKGSE